MIEGQRQRRASVVDVGLHLASKRNTRPPLVCSLYKHLASAGWWFGVPTSECGGVERSSSAAATSGRRMGESICGTHPHPSPPPRWHMTQCPPPHRRVWWCREARENEGAGAGAQIRTVGRALPCSEGLQIESAVAVRVRMTAQEVESLSRSGQRARGDARAAPCGEGVPHTPRMGRRAWWDLRHPRQRARTRLRPRTPRRTGWRQRRRWPAYSPPLRRPPLPRRTPTKVNLSHPYKSTKFPA